MFVLLLSCHGAWARALPFRGVAFRVYADLCVCVFVFVFL